LKLVERKINADKNAKKPRGTPFKPGQTEGIGRPQGTPNKATIWKEFILELGIDPAKARGNLYKLVQEFAANGDSVCIKLLWDMWLPERPKVKDEPMQVDINLNINTIDELLDVRRQILKLVITGEITGDQAKIINDQILPFEKAIEISVVHAQAIQMKRLNDK